MASLSDSLELKAALQLIERFLEEERKANNIPGMSAALVLDQETVWMKGFGFADIENKIPASPQTPYRILSLSKIFTGTMLMQLRDSGKLSLDDPVEKHSPAFRPKSRFAESRPITFRQIASHTSGLPGGLDKVFFPPFDPPSDEEILDGISRIETVLPVMTENRYSDLAISAMGHILGQIAGVPYREYVRQHILEPLGMQSTHFEVPPEAKNRAAVGYHQSGSTVERAPPSPSAKGLDPAGGLWSTVEDMSSFISLQFSENQTGGRQILGATTLREMQKPVFLNSEWNAGYCIDWHTERVKDRVVIGHSGGPFLGFSTVITLVPSLKLGFALFTNTHTDVDGMATFALGILMPVVEKAMARGDRTSEGAPNAELHRYCGRYTVSSFPDVEIALVDRKLLFVESGSPPTTWLTLVPEGEHRFRIKGKYYNEGIAIFETDSSGRPTRLIIEGVVYSRVPENA